MRHIILISGKDSLATALLQTSLEPQYEYEYIFNDVQAELPETYAWIEQVESKTGWQITRLGADLKARIHFYNGFLPSSRARYCTREGKILPLEQYLGNDEATVYYGLRSDENRVGNVPVAGSRLHPKCPLQEHGVDLKGVYDLLDQYHLAPPSFFWPRLHEAVNARLAVVIPGWERILTRNEFDVLFSGRSRGNCFFCFWQRAYEWVWLKETHPDLFAEAAAFERDDYSWRSDWSLEQLDDERAGAVFARRVRKVCGLIAVKNQMQLFDFDDEADNEIAGTSCGLLCGK